MRNDWIIDTICLNHFTQDKYSPRTSATSTVFVILMSLRPDLPNE